MSRVSVISAGETELTLTEALLMYRSGRGEVYATVHPVHADGTVPGRQIIGAGAPLTKSSLSSFARAVGQATSFGGFVPENLLYTSPNMIAWWTPESIRRCWFKSQNKYIGEKAADVAHPALVFVVVPGDWYVFALRESVRPTPSTKLCHSPHFNVWDGGRICTGNVKLPPAIEASAIAGYEDAFFRTRFTHPNREGATVHKGGMTMLWRAQIRCANQEQMRRALRGTHETLERAIARIAAYSQS